MIKTTSRIINILLVLSLFSVMTMADSDALLEQKKGAVEWVDANKAMLADLSDKIWEYAELPMLEYKSSRLLADALEKKGFRVDRGVAGMPTAFVASYGEGKPEIGFLAEYDALPRLSQKPVPYQEPLIEEGSGHGCGHNLLGVGGTAVAMAATGLELMTQPKTLASVRAEWKKLAKDRPYLSPIPQDIKPPVEPEPKKRF